MKMLLILSAILCVALSIRAATVVPAEAAAVQEENKPAPKLGMDAEGAVLTAGRGAALPQARFSFCLDGWQSFRGSCYFLDNHADNWRNAERYCAGFGGSLASVHDIWEYNFLQRLVKTGGHSLAWIGGYYFEGEWGWEDGSMFNYHHWDSPSSYDRYRCLQLNSQESKGWSNHDCGMSFPFVCQVKSNC